MNLVDHFRVIKLLVLKNWRIRLHHKISFCLLFLIPILFTTSMVLLTTRTERSFTMTNHQWSNDTQPTIEQTLSKSIYYNSTNIFENILVFDNRLKSTLNIVFCPTNSFTQPLMERVAKQLNSKFENKFTFNLMGIEMEEQMIDVWRKSSKQQFGVVFKTHSPESKQLFYKISVSDKSVQNIEFYRSINAYQSFEDIYPFDNDYLRYGFSALQLAIDLSHISLLTNTSIDESIGVLEQNMPIPPIDNIDKGWNRSEIIYLTVFILLFSLLVMLPVTVKRIVEERQTTITDYLFLLGVQQIDHWISVIVDAFSIIGLQHFIITLILMTKHIELIHYPIDPDPVTINSHSFLIGIDLTLFLFFSLLFLIQSILFVCLISVFFRSPNIAVIVTILVWIFSFLIPIVYLFGIKGEVSPVLQHFGLELVSCLLPNCALFWFVHISKGLESNTYSGAKWNNIFTPGYLVDQMTITHIIITMIVSYIIYGVLIWYLSSVIPFKHSKHRSFYFPLQSIYETILKKCFKNGSEIYESMFDNQNNAICVKSLSKSYKSLFGFKREKVLKNIDLEINKNSITVILGPNGSGKTTLTNIITGLIESNGKVFINGFNITKEQKMARNLTGICQQQNVYFKFLTLKEHLSLFSELKRVLRKRTDGYTDQHLIDALNLKADVHKEAINLSGGTLRRMVLAMALIGPNDVLLLDEPTASLDPKVRQQVWDLIIDSRKTKSVLITSHHLEEANLLSDQIVIIANGKVCFSGSTLQMKREFDSGYHLKIVKDVQIQTENQIRETVSKFVKIKKVRKSEQGDKEELVFEIDFEENPKLSAMFDELQTKQRILAISNISLGMTTLEDSYAKIVQNTFTKFEQAPTDLNIEPNANLLNNSNDLSKIESNVWKLILRQFYGIFIRRLHYLSKNYILFLTLIVIPFVFVMLFFFSIEGTQIVKKLYKNPILLESQQIYGKGMKAFIASDDIGFTESYSNTLKDNEIREIYLKNKSDIEESLLSFAENNYLQYFHKLLYGISINNNMTKVKVWHNYNAYHSLPISLNLMTNSLLKQMTADNEYDIKTYNSPLPIFWHTNSTINSRQELFKDDTTFPFQLLAFIFGFAFTSASYVLLPITEYRTKFKLLQFMSGLKPLVYWSANFAFDFTVHLICSLVYSSIYHLFDRNQYFIGSEKSFVSTYLLFSFYGFAFIPFVYLVSLAFTKPSSGFTFISLYNIILTPIIMIFLGIITWYIGDAFGIRHCEGNCFGYKLLRELLVFIHPFVLFLNEVNVLHQILYYDNFCQTFNSNISKNFCPGINQYHHNYWCCLPSCNSTYSSNSMFTPRHVYFALRFQKNCYAFIDPIGYIGEYLCLFILYGLIYFVIILIIEMKLYESLLNFVSKIRTKRTENLELQDLESTEVKRETENVKQILTTEQFNSHSLVIDKLTKKFSECLIVPNNISLLVHKEECFGLLGVNGSGKTTIFRLLTGDLGLTSGNAYLGSNADLMQNKRNFFSRIGYCPQNDALLDRLTGMQTLLFFGRIRGLDYKSINQFIERVIEKFQLKEIINKRLSTYSGGNRRKLSLGIALMGNTQLLLLDEPTTGVDPQSRIKIWQLLRDLMNETKLSILLTSHNMTECEALCSRMAILSNGRIKTIGFINDLMKAFAKGFIIILKLSSESKVDELKSEMCFQFGNQCLLKYENFGVIHYNLISESITLSQIFNCLQIIQNKFTLEDYFVSNASLEQVFQSIIESDNESNV